MCRNPTIGIHQVPHLEMLESPERGKAEPTDDSKYFQGIFLRPSNQGYIYIYIYIYIFIEFPPEDAEPGRGKLEKSLYGTRDAALNWAEAYTKVFIAMGYKKGLSSPCSFPQRMASSR